MAYEAKKNSILKSIVKKLKKEKSIKVVCSPGKKIAGLPQTVISGTGISVTEAEKAVHKLMKAALREDAEKIDREFMEDMK